MAEQTQTEKLKDRLTLLSDECYSQELSACPKHPIFQPGKFINLILALPEILIKDPNQSFPDMVFYCLNCEKMVKNTKCNVIGEDCFKVLPKEEK